MVKEKLLRNSEPNLDQSLINADSSVTQIASFIKIKKRVSFKNQTDGKEIKNIFCDV
jgi:hypothetical protein